MEKLMQSIGKGAAAACLVLLTACNGGEKREAAKPRPKVPLPDPPLVSECEPGEYGGRLVVATFGDPKTFNPITSNEGSSDDIIRFLFSGLTSFDWPKQESSPGLAESWKVEPDGKTWTFKLRKGLLWSDGQPLTADDVIFTWNDVIYNPDINNVTVDLFRIDGKDFKVSKVDDLTIRVVTPDIYAPFVDFFGGVPIIPKHILGEAVKNKSFQAAYGINTPPDRLVCNGPFRLRQFKGGQFTILEPNPYFHVVDKKGQRLPYFDAVVYMVVPNAQAVSLRFLKGETDVYEMIQPDEYERYKQEASRKDFRLLDLGLGIEKYFFWFNQNTYTNPATGKPHVDPVKLKWFRDTKFRQAMAYAVDRESIIKSVYAGRAVPNYSYFTKGNKKWHNPDVQKYPFDREKARALLKEIGIEDRNGNGVLEDADGHEIEFVLNTNTGNSIREKTAVLLQEDLKRLGVKLIFQPIEFNALIDKMNNSHDYEAILLSLGGGSPDPAGSMNVLKSDGFTHEWFPRQKTPSTKWEARIDELMNLQIKTLDYEQRKKYMDEVQRILSEECPLIFTVSPYNYGAVKSKIGNVRPTVLSYYRLTWNAEELYFKKE